MECLCVIRVRSNRSTIQIKTRLFCCSCLAAPQQTKHKLTDRQTHGPRTGCSVIPTVCLHFQRARLLLPSGSQDALPLLSLPPPLPLCASHTTVHTDAQSETHTTWSSLEKLLWNYSYTQAASVISLLHSAAAALSVGAENNVQTNPKLLCIHTFTCFYRWRCSVPWNVSSKCAFPFQYFNSFFPSEWRNPHFWKSGQSLTSVCLM